MPLDNILVTIPQFRSNLVLKGVSVPEMILISNHHISIEYIFFFFKYPMRPKSKPSHKVYPPGRPRGTAKEILVLMVFNEVWHDSSQYCMHLSWK